MLSRIATAGCVGVMLLACPKQLAADSWDLPTTYDYYSADSSYFVRIVPLLVPDKYYRWQAAKLKRKNRFSAADTVIVPCHAMLYQRTPTGPRLIWKESLINRIAPVEALVSNDGRYVVTFDNWSSMGYGVDVMVVYNNQGHLLKRYNLEQLSPFPINQYMRSISSMWWRCDAGFVAADRIAICFQTQDKKTQNRTYSLAKLDFE
ncbi:hypothetical protein LJ737_01110 [Hymenobacter sp. 15J16-1T3B]|uniref:hypothetical protein n=1 Tax=Hymenobacter sp. 15J16-1T3B TaxID=2886941 RepID=UPI001D1108BA|nr:hypothetical protein [Hymenobacter sp. 15J16-1T3B]MCC3155816.1 hypothetical protein [Hymenobacter sp. 15J16-1T3B]